MESIRDSNRWNFSDEQKHVTISLGNIGYWPMQGDEHPLIQKDSGHNMSSFFLFYLWLSPWHFLGLNIDDMGVALPFSILLPALWLPSILLPVLNLGNEGMIQSIIMNDNPSNPQQPIHSLCVSRTSKYSGRAIWTLKSFAWPCNSSTSLRTKKRAGSEIGCTDWVRPSRPHDARPASHRSEMIRETFWDRCSSTVVFFHHL